MPILYFNLTWRCNEDCWFCAARRRPHADLSRRRIFGIFDRFQVGSGDFVIINGGEPALYSGLEAVLAALRRRGVRSNLFTNGTLLADKARARRMAEAGLDYVCVPFYGQTAREHEVMTRSRGSFGRVCAGLHNLAALKAQGYAITVELKLLHCRPIYRQNQSLASWLVRTFPSADCISINPPLYTGRAREQLARFAVDLRKTSKWLNETAREIIRHGFRLSIPHIPYCVLETQLRRDAFRNSFLPYPLRDPILYFDPSHLSGVVNSRPSPNNRRCRRCGYAARCPTFNPYNLGGVAGRGASRAEPVM